jgi:hypothetical protein
LVNGRWPERYPAAEGSLDIAVIGRNLFDRKYRTYGIDFGPGLGFAGNSYGDPRTFGLQLAYNFTAGEAAPSPPPPARRLPPLPPAKIVLRSVHFDFDKATLRRGQPILDEAVQVLKKKAASTSSSKDTLTASAPTSTTSTVPPACGNRATAWGSRIARRGSPLRAWASRNRWHPTTRLTDAPRTVA